MNRLRYLVAAYLFVVVSLSPLPAWGQAGDRPVRLGDTGPAVVVVQTQLRSLGYTVAVDGRFGRQTDRAVRHWQHANNLTVDGIVGPQTLSTFPLKDGAASGAQRPAADRSSGSGSPASPEQIIRAVWPDDVEDRAVAIAYRESRLTPTARNACCYGLFQIHYRAHQSWLTLYGVRSATDLLDPVTNARVALALYQSAGWGPWAT